MEQDTWLGSIKSLQRVALKVEQNKNFEGKNMKERA
jgi:hypothetical protein